MWRAFDETGRLMYPDFIETVVRLMPMYWVRVVGGSLYVVGVFMLRLEHPDDVEGATGGVRGAGDSGGAAVASAWTEPVVAAPAGEGLIGWVACDALSPQVGGDAAARSPCW